MTKYAVKIINNPCGVKGMNGKYYQAKCVYPSEPYDFGSLNRAYKALQEFYDDHYKCCGKCNCIFEVVEYNG